MQEKSRNLISKNQLKSRKICSCRGRSARIRESGEIVIKGRVTSMNPSNKKNRQFGNINALVDSYDSIQEVLSNPSKTEKDPVLKNETKFFEKMLSWLKQFIR
ncbi:hypothetical protein CN271_08170 [Bacillus cereus]|uniref:hypothetical protein n=1 Tax=Bacillus cereus TaxID=1396 RepID=UPI000BEB8ED0|nr:hypothetical protein [Bacillus cereus]PEE35254.1 hypothetical protein CON59_16685 [Bacillus cereus]PET44362.1 hypothetical protein CN523_19520 [Bacillus cereus]PFA58439.1 hypothetical protein CN389_06385 [Bacillus cereus]PFD76764.1 hypothetical protein CN271_08170 [Bacillus cereus]PFE77844.1 hypothetical protein CN319_12695 [Bacillus cereus]